MKFRAGLGGVLLWVGLVLVIVESKKVAFATSTTCAGELPASIQAQHAARANRSGFVADAKLTADINRARISIVHLNGFFLANVIVLIVDVARQVRAGLDNRQVRFS